MDEVDPGIELRIAGELLLQARHANQHHPDAALVEDGPHLLQPGHLQAVGLVDQDQGGAIGLGTLTPPHPFEDPPPESRGQAAGVASCATGRGNLCGSMSRCHRGDDSGRRRQAAQPGGMTYTFSRKVQ